MLQILHSKLMIFVAGLFKEIGRDRPGPSGPIWILVYKDIARDRPGPSGPIAYIHTQYRPGPSGTVPS
jgi:hypothetical protein